MTIKTKLSSLATATMSVLAAFLIIVAPVPAGAAQSDCPASAKVCFWENSNYSGQRLDYYSVPVGYCWNVIASMNDKITGLWNKTGGQLTIYQHANCQGAAKSFNNNIAVNNLGIVPILFNDETSSFMRVW